MLPMPGMYIWPVSSPESPPPVESNDQTSSEQANNEQKPDKVLVPVFMNKARQVQPFSLPLNSSEPGQHWTAAGTALILDPGKTNIQFTTYM